VGESGGYPQLAAVFRTEGETDPLAKSGRAFSDIHSDIKHLAGGDPHQFTLRLLDLVVQAPQDILGGTGVVVLDKLETDAGFLGKSPPVEAFIKKASLV